MALTCNTKSDITNLQQIVNETFPHYSKIANNLYFTKLDQYDPNLRKQLQRTKLYTDQELRDILEQYNAEIIGQIKQLIDTRIAEAFNQNKQPIYNIPIVQVVKPPQ